MRVALPTSEYVTEPGFDGGLSNYTHRLALSLSRMGHRPVVFTSSDRNESVEHEGIEVHRVDVSLGRFLNLLNYLTLGKAGMTLILTAQSRALNRRIRRVHAEEPFDVIQYPHLGAIGLFGVTHVPRVIRLSSHQPSCERMGEGGAGPPHGWQQYFLEKRAMRATEHVFGPSRVIADIVSKDIGKPVKVIEPPFFIETSVLDERPYADQLEGERYLVFVGTLNELKGVAVIAEMLHDLLSACPDLLFVFIGKDREPSPGEWMMDRVWEKAGEYRGRVLYLGTMVHAQLYPILSRAAAVVLPSRIDNLPNTCLEAMGHGRVVIGTRGTSFDQLIEDGENGFLCDVDDPDGLLCAVRRALALSPEERERMGEKARERVDRMRPEEAMKPLLELYRRAMDGDS